MDAWLKAIASGHLRKARPWTARNKAKQETCHSGRRGGGGRTASALAA